MYPPFSVGDEGAFPSWGRWHWDPGCSQQEQVHECQAPACLAEGSDTPFVLGTLNAAAVLPGIRHCLVTKPPGHPSLHPVIISAPPVFRINVENALHWQLLDVVPPYRHLLSGTVGRILALAKSPGMDFLLVRGHRLPHPTGSSGGEPAT